MVSRSTAVIRTLPASWINFERNFQKPEVLKISPTSFTRASSLLILSGKIWSFSPSTKWAWARETCARCTAASRKNLPSSSPSRTRSDRCRKKCVRCDSSIFFTRNSVTGLHSPFLATTSRATFFFGKALKTQANPLMRSPLPITPPRTKVDFDDLKTERFTPVNRSTSHYVLHDVCSSCAAREGAEQHRRSPSNRKHRFSLTVTRTDVSNYSMWAGFFFPFFCESCLIVIFWFTGSVANGLHFEPLKYSTHKWPTVRWLRH